MNGGEQRRRDGKHIRTAEYQNGVPQHDARLWWKINTVNRPMNNALPKLERQRVQGRRQRMNERKKTEDEHVSTGKATLRGIKYEQRMRGNEQATEWLSDANRSRAHTESKILEIKTNTIKKKERAGIQDKLSSEHTET